ncbi:unnamed protein product [Caenorhabditis auriculariae]|uniref:Uncharacterized protein n=1 Tax=Caenorhabditis auriculariae TaxID=2777116 RepID=A0A8S1HKU2_9PELO|nr:unnamed protein product [Caenorhabditis auriculariae]
MAARPNRKKKVEKGSVEHEKTPRIAFLPDITPFRTTYDKKIVTTVAAPYLLVFFCAFTSILFLCYLSFGSPMELYVKNIVDHHKIPPLFLEYEKIATNEELREDGSLVETVYNCSGLVLGRWFLTKAETTYVKNTRGYFPGNIWKRWAYRWLDLKTDALDCSKCPPTVIITTGYSPPQG